MQKNLRYDGQNFQSSLPLGGYSKNAPLPTEIVQTQTDQKHVQYGVRYGLHLLPDAEDDLGISTVDIPFVGVV